MIMLVILLPLYSIVMVTFHIFSERLHVKPTGLSDGKVALFTNKKYDFAVHYL